MRQLRFVPMSDALIAHCLQGLQVGAHWFGEVLGDAGVVEEDVEEASGVSVGDGGVWCQAGLDKGFGDGEWAKSWIRPSGGRQVGGLEEML